MIYGLPVYSGSEAIDAINSSYPAAPDVLSLLPVSLEAVLLSLLFCEELCTVFCTVPDVSTEYDHATRPVLMASASVMASVT